jgi:acyl-CoA reductase-like NAD-dependent aldehyde dehydrogenase
MAEPAARSDTSTSLVDDAVATVRDGRRRWATTTPAARAALLLACRDRFFAVAPRLVAQALQQKGLTAEQPEAGEEWAFVTGTLKLFRVYASALQAVARDGRPAVKGPWRVRRTDDGRDQVVVDVAPLELSERLALGNGRGELWLESGLSLAEAQARQGERWRAVSSSSSASSPPPVLALLAAGNVWMLLVGDLLHALCLRGVVVVAKLNPTHAWQLPLWREVLAPLIDAGALALIDGDAAVGARLCAHDDVALIHMTGSHRTHDAVVFGAGPEGEARRRRGERLNHRPVSAELGNVTPVFVVPGPWTPQELRYHAIQLGSQHGLNAAFNCLTPRLIVTSSSWLQRGAFLDELRAFFDVLPRRRAWYPGAAARHARFVAAHPEATRHGPGGGDPTTLPWTLVTGLRLDDAAAADEICFHEESFCSVLAEATVEADDAPTFLRRAVELVQTRVWGNLCATLLVHPATLRDHAADVEDAIARLRYGSVGVNAFASIAYVTPSLSWGAFPGNEATDIRSGCDVVHNVLDLPSPQKAVLRSPFTLGPTPPLDLRWPKTTPVLREVAALEHRPGVSSGLRVARALLRH